MAAFRLPNILQNLLGEGSLSASFIPVYSRLLARGDAAGARRLAGAVAGLLGVLVGLVVLGGIVLAPVLVDLLTPGFEGAKRDLTVLLVRVLFPGTGMLVLSAWCLGLLNSHHRFFLSYAAPAAWNLTIVAALIGFGPGAAADRVALIAALAAVAGSLLQFLIQLPGALKAAGPIRPSLRWSDPDVAETRRTFVPALASRGVAQVSAWVDLVIASLLPTGAVAGLVNAQLLYTLPVSLFGMSIAAAELPGMSRATAAGDGGLDPLRLRIRDSLSRVAFFVVPSAAAFIGLGHLVAILVFQSGRFTGEDARFVWGVLAGSSVGLLAATMARVLSSALYALGDTRTPLRFAAIRVALATLGGFLLATRGPAVAGIDPRWGVAGLTLAGGLAGWLEFLLLRRHLDRRLGTSLGVGVGVVGRLWLAAGAGLALAWVVFPLLPDDSTFLRPLAGLGTFGLAYLALTSLLRVPEAAALGRAFRRGRGP